MLIGNNMLFDYYGISLGLNFKLMTHYRWSALIDGPYLLC